MSSVCQKDSRFRAYLRRVLALFLTAVILAGASCAPAPPPPPPVPIPSSVVTEEGLEFSVYGLKLPGTSQELKFRHGGALTWLPLNIVESLRLSGPVQDGYRQATVTLISWEQMKGELFVGQLVDGHTDTGYWNMPLERVRRLSIGSE